VFKSPRRSLLKRGRRFGSLFLSGRLGLFSGLFLRRQHYRRQ
jgi:hypothetical protein